ncbi:MAG: helicase-associated domain-containing protein, partial [Acidimicrobiales bacterium]
LELSTEVESEAGARGYRLSEERITRAVLAGDDPADICDFLDELSAVPITDTVRRLVHDAARRAGKVKVMSATTLVVTSDPADLVTACKVKAAKLVSVAPTVAVSSQTPAKVRAALDRRGLSPELVAGDTGALPAPRRSRDDAEALEISARRAREAATRFGHEGFKAHAERLTRQAAQARDPGSRLVVSAPLALTPALVEQMAGIADGSRSAEAPRTARTAPTAPSADDSRG